MLCAWRPRASRPKYRFRRSTLRRDPQLSPSIALFRMQDPGSLSSEHLREEELSSAPPASVADSESRRREAPTARTPRQLAPCKPRLIVEENWSQTFSL